MTPPEWVGKVVALVFNGRRKPQLVRIDSYELASDTEGVLRVWFWGRYA